MKHPWKSRDNRPLQTSLTIDFLLFNCMLLMLVLVVYLFVQKDIAQVIRERMTPDPNLSVEAGTYREELGQGPESERLLKSGGWLELLDSGKRVIQVIGEKQDEVLLYDEDSLYLGLENRSDQPFLLFYYERNGAGYRGSLDVA
ncbi:hypothetical protein ACFTAO_21525 [Paenibacillus rhizoplanae]